MAHLLRYLIPTALAAGALAFAWHWNQAQPMEVRVAEVGTGLVEKRIANTRAGTIKACRRAKLAPSVGGQIAALPVREGQRVEPGALLLELWNQDLLAQVTLAEREADAGQARAEAACQQAAQARREADRQTRLQSKGGASEDTLDRAITEAHTRQSECQAAQATARVYQAKLGVAQAQLAKTRLTAPFAGVIAEVNGELNEFVTPSPPGIPTLPAVDLIDDSCFYVSAPIDEVDAPAVALGQDARVTLDAYGNQHFRGRVRRVAPYVLDLEKQARTLEVEVEISAGGPDLALLAGYSADVEIIADRRDAVLRIPTEALLDDKQVYRFDPEAGLLRKVKVRPGLGNWEWTQIEDGLQAGQQVVVSLAQAGLADGVVARAAGKPGH